MVSSSALIETIAKKLRQYEAKNIVVDPVMVATSGAKLINDEAIEALKSQLLPMAPRPRSGRREAHRRRQVHGDAGGRGRGVSRRQISALHGAFLPQRFLCCAQIQGQNCGKNAQGDPRPGEQESVP